MGDDQTAELFKSLNYTELTAKLVLKYLHRKVRIY